MSLWKNSVMTTFYHSYASDETPCAVKIDQGGILVEYETSENGLTTLRQYQGENDGTGHFRLTMTAEGSSGKATLHMFPSAQLLVGNWVENSMRGMWSIALA